MVVVSRINNVVEGMAGPSLVTVCHCLPHRRQGLLVRKLARELRKMFIVQKITKWKKGKKVFWVQLLFADRKKGKKGHIVDTARPGGLKIYVQKV